MLDAKVTEPVKEKKKHHVASHPKDAFKNALFESFREKMLSRRKLISEYKDKHQNNTKATNVTPTNHSLTEIYS